MKSVSGLAAGVTVGFCLSFSASMRASAPPTAAEAAFPQTEPMAAGPFQPTWESLGHYEVPEWFRDAKFGIWAHWGPQCQPEMGDWYAKWMYLDEKTEPWSRALAPYHTLRYGPPSEFGFKDVIHIWWAENWNPEHLMALYKRAGAHYFMALASHHDNFDNFDSKYQPWNSTRVGPKKDLVGGWAKAARAAGLRFAVSVHASHAWSWYEVSQGADKTGPKAGVPYDGKLTAADGKGKWWNGLDPQDLYAQNHPVGNAGWDWELKPAATGPDDPRLPDAAYLRKYYNRTVDLINKYRPDMIYFDDTALPFDSFSDVGRKIAAHYYNASLAEHGKVDVVINGKHLDETQKKAIVYDIERGKSPDILPRPWQTDTCLGDWHYQRSIYERHAYKTSLQVIQMLADVVSKNGNLMLNVPLRGDGTPDPDEIQVLRELGDWMDVNAESIFGTRPWKVYGEGPAQSSAKKGQFDGIADVGQFTAQDVRYTTKGPVLYAIVLGWPEDGKVDLAAFRDGGTANFAVGKVRLLGSKAAVPFSQDESGLHVHLPGGPSPSKASSSAIVLKITQAR
ncbi:MAG TPA: alpha-L-fucosidase [Candidatus Didemnitutus sp.]|nr:alpha-L-fucosidase [Candidatus Didemnitutus sp.]